MSLSILNKSKMERNINGSKSLEIPKNYSNGGPKIKYKIKKNPIGKGSFSTVYYATDDDNNEYAVKRISVIKLDQSRLDKFLLELDISIKMIHPNIVTCHEIFKTPSYWYIVSEYCNYGTFGDLIMALKPIEYKKKENLAHYYLGQLKNALGYLHKNKIIHRDLKPMNILMTKNDNNEVVVKLADFGFARYFEYNPQNHTGYDDMVATICGSPIYMAPELLINNKYNTKADLWSFGIIMYELLYSTNPYNYPKNISHLKYLMEKQVIQFDDENKNLNFSLDSLDLMKKLLQIDPENRINWNDFFSHQWFKKIPYEEEMCNNDVNSDSDVENEDDIFEFEDDSTTYASNLSKLSSSGKSFKYNYVENYFDGLCGSINTSATIGPDNEYIFVEENGGFRNSNIKVYNETYTSSIIKIVTSTVSYFFGQAKSY